MNLAAPRKWLVLLGLLLGACVTTSPLGRGEDEPSEPVSASWEEARADPSCMVPLCVEEHCAIWRCQDVVEVDDSPSVVLAQAVAPAPAPMLPLVEPPLHYRWWGLPLAAPTISDPVFEIPWRNWKVREQEARKPWRHYCLTPPREPFEKHHIFPQQAELAQWFARKGIDIHAFTIRLPKSFHQWLHSGGPKGGQWNEAWRQFAREKGEKAKPEDIWRFAGELMMRFGVNGPLVPYSCD